MAPVSKGRSVAAARSRNTTPMSTASTDVGSLPSNTAASPMSYAEIADLCRSSTTPSSTILRKLADGLRQRSEIAKARSDHHDKSFREFAKRKEAEVVRQHELEADREREEEELRLRAKSKDLKKEGAVVVEDGEEQRPLAVGARGLARQDGIATEGQPDAPPPDQLETQPLAGRKRSHAEASDSDESTLDARQPRPAPPKPQFQTFGPDPSVFDDPTIYHIRDPNEAASEEEKKEILSVAVYPTTNLYDLTCGTAPDRDLVNAKPAQQTSAHVYAQYLEPYFRRYAEEDLQWLKERGDRVNPMIIPPRGTRSYKEVWADEDNEAFDDRVKASTTASTANQAHGSIEQMSEDVTETSDVSIGPMLARLLQCMRPERRADPTSNGTTNATTNGDTTMVNGVDGDVSMADGQPNGQEEQLQLQRTSTRRDNLPPATALPESAMLGTNARNNAAKPSWAELDERVKQELRYIGFLSEDAEPDYDGHYDDDIAARLRFLQEELQRVSEVNGARKSRLSEVVTDSMTQEEWSGVLEALETDLNQAYTKRHRNTSKGKGKLKRAGAAAGHGTEPGPGVAVPAGYGIGRPAIGENIKEIVRKRYEWMSKLGHLVNWGRIEVPKESIFGDGVMRDHLIREKESWAESQDV